MAKGTSAALLLNVGFAPSLPDFTFGHKGRHDTWPGAEVRNGGVGV